MYAICGVNLTIMCFMNFDYSHKFVEQPFCNCQFIQVLIRKLNLLQNPKFTGVQIHWCLKSDRMCPLSYNHTKRPRSGSFEVLMLVMMLGNGSGTHFGASQCIPMGSCRLTRRLTLGVVMPLIWSAEFVNNVTSCKGRGGSKCGSGVTCLDYPRCILTH